MVDEITGNLDGTGLSVGVVVSDFNEALTNQLKDGALGTLKETGVDPDDMAVYHAPGAFELPSLARKVHASQNHDGLIGLGVVIRGETPHFDYVSSRVTRGMGSLADDAKVPVTFGVLTTDTVDQARDRSGTKAGNKGREAARALVRMASVYEKLDG